MLWGGGGTCQIWVLTPPLNSQIWVLAEYEYLCVFVILMHSFFLNLILGCKAALELENLLTKPQLLKDISMLSPRYQTSNVEAKHCLDIQCAPKHTAFGYIAMKARYVLRITH